MLLFLQRLKPLVFSLETPLSIVLGIIMGIIMGLPYYIGLLVLFGWALIPAALVQLLSGHTGSTAGGGSPDPGWVIWADWGVVFFYILFLACFVWYAYRATRRTGSGRNAILATLWSVLVMVLSGIIPMAITMMWMQRSLFSTLPFFLGTSVGYCFLFAVPLSAMALLAAWAGSWLGKRRSAHMSIETV